MPVMLILPLHHPITRANFPLATALLVLVNVFIFLGLQSGDGRTMAQAQQQYVDSGLGRYESPAYERHLQVAARHEELAALREVPEPARAVYVSQHTLNDVAFAAALHRGEYFDSAADFDTWRPLRAVYETRQSEVFTLRHVMRSSEADPWRMFASAFLHGGLMHLIGNMVFLIALGLLVEGALGSARFLGVYVLGAMGAGAASLYWRWGDAGGGLGASGAIAALMGAFCVVWGRQPVRFFYWVGVVFDYVRAPAIWLLPLWLGWEIYNLLANGDIGIGFDAHAGGLISGALMGAALVALGQVRDGFIHADHADDPGATTGERWQQAQAHLGKLQLREAETLLAQLAQEQPQRFDVRVARYRVARHAGDRAIAQQRAQEVLALAVADRGGVQAQQEVLADLHQAGDAIDDSQHLALAQRWLGLGELDATQDLLRAIEPNTAWAPQFAQLWFELALDYRDRHAPDAHASALRSLIARHPEQPQAAKARFLLENAVGPA